MRRFVIYGTIAGVFLVSAASVEAQRGQATGPQNPEPSTGLQSSHPDPMDPKGGTVLVDLVPVSSGSSDAGGHAVFNYLKGQDTYVVQVNVHGLEPQEWYQVHLAVHREESRGDAGTFRTDSEGKGRAHMSVGELDSFNIVNIRRPGVPGSRVLTSWLEDGGTLEETPDQRLP